MKPFPRLPSSLRIGRLGQNAVYGSVGLGLRAIIQAGYLILLSRWMGANGYGLFAGSMAVVMLVAPLSGWGIGYVLTRRVARDRLHSRSLWASALAQIAATGAILVVLVVLLAGFVLKQRIDLASMLLIAIAELVLLPVAQAASALLLALERGFLAALAVCAVPAGRLLSGVAFWELAGARSPEIVATSHFCGSLASIAALLVAVAWIDGLPSWRERLRIMETIRSGSGYAVGAVVGSSYQEVDKVFMLQLLGEAAVGPYTVAFRVISVFALPVSALASAALPRLFATHGGAAAPRMMRAVVIASVIYGLAATIGAICVSPWMPTVFGQGFSGSTRYLLFLSPWPILFALHQSLATGLTGFGRQRARVVVESIGLLLAAGLNALLLRALGPGASALALLAAEATMAAGCAFVVWRLRGGPREPTAALRVS